MRVLGYLKAGAVTAADRTYRSDALAILGLDADDEFPLAQGPTGFVFAGWLPEPAFLSLEYEDATDHSLTSTETIPYRRFFLEFAEALLALAETHCSNRRPLRLLDFGCGQGHLLRLLGSRDVETFGYEPSAARLEWASGGTTLTSLDNVAAAGPFDIFVCTEVLEHVAEPRAVLRFFKANAAPGALLALTVPNCSPAFIAASLADSAAGQLPPGVLNPWEHLNHFTAASLRMMLAEEGFDVVRDFGSTAAAVQATRAFGSLSGAKAVLLNCARVVKRLLRPQPTTQLFCRVAS